MGRLPEAKLQLRAPARSQQAVVRLRRVSAVSRDKRAPRSKRDRIEVRQTVASRLNIAYVRADVRDLSPRSASVRMDAAHPLGLGSIGLHARALGDQSFRLERARDASRLATKALLTRV